MSKHSLSLTYNIDVKRQADEKRKFNINAFSSLSRKNLEFRRLERRLYIYNTSVGEKIWIQYPGKETLTGKPWDFRPKMYLKTTSKFMPDLAFPDIWDDITDIHTGNPEALQVFAAVLFRMAFMVDHSKEIKVCKYDDVNVETEEVINSGEVEITFYAPKFDVEIISSLQAEVGSLRGATLEAYLLYNDLLVQNEDCKYFYRDMYERRGKWDSSIGRRNTLLTHLSVIEYIQGRVKFSEIMNRFQRGRGVAPIKLDSISSITGGIINK